MIHIESVFKNMSCVLQLRLVRANINSSNDVFSKCKEFDSRLVGFFSILLLQFPALLELDFLDLGEDLSNILSLNRLVG